MLSRGSIMSLITKASPMPLFRNQSILTALSAMIALMLTWPCAAQQAALFDELQPLYPDTNVKAGGQSQTTDVPRSSFAGVHVLITDLPKNAILNWELRQNNHPIACQSYQLIDVPVEQNTGLESRTEKWDGRENPHVIRRAPFRVFEALKPTQSPLQTDVSVAAMRIELPIPTRSAVGEFDYKLIINSGAWSQTLRWRVRVHEAKVPPIGRNSLGYTNWFSLRRMARDHNLTMWGEAHWSMIEKYAQLMARGRQNMFQLHWPSFIHVDESGDVHVDESRLNRYVNLFTDAGLYYIEGAQPAYRAKSDWSSKRLAVRFSSHEPTSDAAREDLSRVLDRINQILEQNSWRGRLLQHIADEPTDTNAADYRALADLLHERLPGVKLMEATMSRDLVGAVDVWCPQVQKYQEHQAFFEKRKQAGDRAWVYTCLAPGGPWLNRLLDQQRLRPVYLGWALVKYDLDGFLHWGLNHHRKNPFEVSVAPHGDGPPNFLPAGDSHIVYPGENGPWSSQRFEAHRIGLEDAELLRLLKVKNPKSAETIIERVLRAFDDYETEVPAYRQVRRELLEAMAESP